MKPYLQFANKLYNPFSVHWNLTFLLANIHSVSYFDRYI